MDNIIKPVDDLQQIKKHYGEKMMQLCRSLFPTILETPGLLFKLMSTNFESSHCLYEDLDVYAKIGPFKDYIYGLLEDKEPAPYKEVVSPEELLNDVGYILYECETDEDIQKFKKYYQRDEQLCTFKANRLKRCYVFFAVKKNVDSIKREDFEHPERQDEYGTSVISIQFTRDGANTLSIKNRYNHKVKNPDATFSNNLNNIAPDLVLSFEQHYGMIQPPKNAFELRNYVKASDGKYYKYNYEINNIYYCPNNIIIDNYEVIRLPKESTLLIDYYILNLKNKEFKLYDETIEDSFPQSMPNINKIEVKKGERKKQILISNNEVDKNVEIIIDEDNMMNSFINKTINNVDNDFFPQIKRLKSLQLPSAQRVGRNFLIYNTSISNLELPLLEQAGSNFLSINDQLESLNMPLLRQVDYLFLYSNNKISVLNLPMLETVGDDFLPRNKKIVNLELPSLVQAGNGFMHQSEQLKSVNMPLLKKIGSRFLKNSQRLKDLKLPLLEEVGDDFLSNNVELSNLVLPSLKKVGDNFLYHNMKLTHFETPLLREAGEGFFHSNSNINYIKLSLLKLLRNNILDYYQKFNNGNNGQER